MMASAIRYFLVVLLIWSWADDVLISATVPMESSCAAEDDEYLAGPASLTKTSEAKQQAPAAHFAISPNLPSICSMPRSLPGEGYKLGSELLHTFMSMQC